MDLPSPVPQEREAKNGTNDMPQPVLKQGTERNPEFTVQQSASQQPSGLPAPLAQTTTTVQQQTNAAQATAPPPQLPATTDMPQMADDIDLIEKEWVEKAKQIVEKTREDPRAQTEALDKVKSEYQKRRFNREAKNGKVK